MRLQPQVEVAALARQVAAQTQVERIDTARIPVESSS